MPDIERSVIGWERGKFGPLAISIVGMAQAGKTTLNNGIYHQIRAIEGDATIVNFSNSAGYRGFTYEALKAAALTDITAIDPAQAEDVLSSYLESGGGSAEEFDGYYRKPGSDEQWRSPAVNATVQYAGIHSGIHDLVNDASSRFMGDVLRDPSLMRLTTCPDFIVLDARNLPECQEKFDTNGLRQISSFILTCDPKVVVDRTRPKTDAERNMSVEERVQVLAGRNKADREREKGAMTLPEDYPESIQLSNAVVSQNIENLLYAGVQMASYPDRKPISIDTAHTSIEDIDAAMKYVLRGAFWTL